MTKIGYTLVMLLPLVAMSPVRAQEAISQTRVAPREAVGPPAHIEDLAWLAGQWEGPGIDGAPAQESYSSAFGGTMVGTFVQRDAKGGVMFYEFIQIAPEAGSLVVRLKHFGPDMVGWEEKNEDFVRFPLIAHEGDSWYFNGMTFRKEGDQGYFVAVRMKETDGAHSELIFRFRRVR